jgi:UDP-N-acetylmuramoylalanine--D-glutamate ligase
MADYRRCKAHILAFQTPTDWAVLNQDDEASRDIARRTAQVLRFSLQGDITSGAFLRGDELVLRHGGEQVLCRRGDLLLRGRHNVANVLAAACCGLASGLPLAAMRQVAVAFAGVPHRLETVCRRRDVLWVNDSIATSPERAIAALNAYSEPIVLLAGGRDKHLSWERWADLVLYKARLVIAFGELRPIAERVLAEARQRAGITSGAPPLHLCDTLEDAVALADGLALSGDVVLLSPGGTSFDAFGDFEARGERFREVVRAL